MGEVTTWWLRIGSADNRMISGLSLVPPRARSTSPHSCRSMVGKQELRTAFKMDSAEPDPCGALAVTCTSPLSSIRKESANWSRAERTALGAPQAESAAMVAVASADVVPAPKCTSHAVVPARSAGTAMWRPAPW